MLYREIITFAKILTKHTKAFSVQKTSFKILKWAVNKWLLELKGLGVYSLFFLVFPRSH